MVFQSVVRSGNLVVRGQLYRTKKTAIKHAPDVLGSVLNFWGGRPTSVEVWTIECDSCKPTFAEYNNLNNIKVEVLQCSKEFNFAE